MVRELEALAVHYPRPDMDPRKWMILYGIFWEDLGHLTLERLRELCRAYRKNPENRFFPTIGQLLHADPDPAPPVPASRRFVPPTDEPPTPEAIERIRQLAENLRIVTTAQAIETGQPHAPHATVWMTPEEEKARVPKLLENLERRLKAKQLDIGSGQDTVG